MATAYIVLKQIIIMVILAFVGFVLFRKQKITKEGSKTIANILIFISLPCVIINSFMSEQTPQKLAGLALSVVAALILLVVSILIAKLFFRNDAIASFAAAFSNAGFIGIPLIVDVLGGEAVFYIAPFIAILNLLQWTYGVSLLTGKKAGLKPKAVITAPFMIAIIIGLAIFISGIEVPALFSQVVSHMAGLNTPLAMFAVGIYIAEVDFKKMISRKQNYMVSLVRLIIVPAVTLLMLKFLPENFHDMRLALFIAAACPVGSNVAVYAQLHDKDYPYAVETVVTTTLLSVVTLPLAVLVTNIFW